ncbi:MAG: flagellar assembly protein FliW [Acidobacteriia bacterium]|nr:flagellar assembly protein FliW [Terriglobia bacterium]
MPKLTTVHFNELEYDPEAVFTFPGGLPGFEDETSFLFIEQPHTRPLVFMQSLRNPGLCFLALPALTVEPEYRLSLSSEDLAALALPSGATPQIGSEMGCFVLVTVAEDAGPTVNLMSPVVVNLRDRRGIQAIPAASPYSLHHPLPLEKETVSCS